MDLFSFLPSAKTADFYQQQSDKPDYGAQLQSSAERLADMLGIDKATINLQLAGRDLSVSLGNYEAQGYRLDVYMYSGGTFDRIILSLGKGLPYTETRDSADFDKFFNSPADFADWLEQSLSHLEDQVNKRQVQRKEED